MSWTCFLIQSELVRISWYITDGAFSISVNFVHFSKLKYLKRKIFLVNDDSKYIYYILFDLSFSLKHFIILFYAFTFAFHHYVFKYSAQFNFTFYIIYKCMVHMQTNTSFTCGFILLIDFGHFEEWSFIRKLCFEYTPNFKYLTDNILKLIRFLWSYYER